MNDPWKEFTQFARTVAFPPSPLSDPLRCGDLYCGESGSGFGVAARDLGLDVVYALEPNRESREAYRSRFGLLPHAKIGGRRVPDFNLLFGHLPGSAAEFDAVILPLINGRRPVGVVLGGSGDLDGVEEVWDHIKRRMEAGGYAVSYRSLDSEPAHYPLGLRHLIVAGTFRREPFPWDEVERLALERDAARDHSTTEDPGVVSAPVAQAVVEVMVEFVTAAASAAGLLRPSQEHRRHQNKDHERRRG